MVYYTGFFLLGAEKMIIPSYLKEASKVIGYFSYTNSGQVICNGDACIIGGSEELMQFYLSRMSTCNGKEIIKKTRFGEVMNGLKQGGAYAFDQESYKKFLHLAKMNRMHGFPTNDFFSVPSPTEMHFIRIQNVV